MFLYNVTQLEMRFDFQEIPTAFRGTYIGQRKMISNSAYAHIFGSKLRMIYSLTMTLIKHVAPLLGLDVFASSFELFFIEKMHL